MSLSKIPEGQLKGRRIRLSGVSVILAESVVGQSSDLTVGRKQVAMLPLLSAGSFFFFIRSRLLDPSEGMVSPTFRVGLSPQLILSRCGQVFASPR